MNDHSHEIAIVYSQRIVGDLVTAGAAEGVDERDIIMILIGFRREDLPVRVKDGRPLYFAPRIDECAARNEISFLLETRRQACHHDGDRTKLKDHLIDATKALRSKIIVAMGRDEIVKSVMDEFNESVVHRVVDDHWYDGSGGIYVVGLSLNPDVVRYV